MLQAWGLGCHLEYWVKAGVLRCEEFQLDSVKELGEESVTEEHAGSCPIFRKVALEMEPQTKPGL